MTSAIRIIIALVIIFAITKIGDNTGNGETVEWLKIGFTTFLIYAVHRVDKMESKNTKKENDENLQ